MENNFDTIVAIATQVSAGAIGIIRISGDLSFNIASEIFTGNIENKKICYGFIKDKDKLIDEVILLPFKAPKSYTGEDIIEIQTHGNYLILNTILELIITKGARLAQKGEFTKRAFLNHRIDLSQAEAVLDIINSKCQKSSEAALNNLEGYLKTKINYIKTNLTDLYSKLIASVDFPDEVEEVSKEYVVSICNDNIYEIDKVLASSKSHNLVRDGINICLIGKPNAGKSSLFNALLNYNRAIVTPIEGTTRDTINETLNLDGFLVNIIDTAGIRDKNNADEIEKIGIEQSIKAIKNSQIVLFLFENSKAEIENNLINIASDKEIIYVQTKSDLNKATDNDCILTSSLTSFGINELKNEIVKFIKKLAPEDTSYTTNLRQQTCLNNAKKSLLNLIKTANSNYNSDLFSCDIKEALLSLDEITGEVLTDNILDNIFDNFCIGK